MEPTEYDLSVGEELKTYRAKLFNDLQEALGGEPLYFLLVFGDVCGSYVTNVLNYEALATQFRLLADALDCKFTPVDPSKLN